MADMATLQFRLTASRKDDIAAVCALGKDRLEKIASRIESDRFTIRRSQIEHLMQAEAGPDGAALARVVFGVASTFRRTFLSAQGALDRLSNSLNDARRNDSRFRSWDECREALRRILETRSVTLAAKALDISYDFERVYLAGRLLTSVRPVFDDSREEVMGSTIVQTLRLDYLAPNGDQSSISIAMDLDDIHTLRRECDLAIKKAEAAKVRFEGPDHEAIIPGEEVDE